MLVNEPFENSLKARKQSVLCKCGHRVYIDHKKEFQICNVCGKKHFNNREIFKKNLKKILELRNEVI